MATKKDVIDAISSLIEAVKARPAGSGGVSVDYIAITGLVPTYAMNYETDGAVPPATVAAWQDFTGFTAALPGIVNPRDIIVVNGVLTIRNNRKISSRTSASIVSADTVVPVTVTCAVGSDGRTLRVSLPRVSCNRPSGQGPFVSTDVIAWTPIATARYSQ